MKYGVAGLGLVATVVIAGALSAAPPANPPANPAAGAVVFRKCALCHTIDPSGRNGLGPNLRGVAGRRAGTLAGFAYSPAMKASGLVWNEQALARFLAAPRQMVPGTRMTFAGLPNPQERADVIAFLRQNGAVRKK